MRGFWRAGCRLLGVVVALLVVAGQAGCGLVQTVRATDMQLREDGPAQDDEFKKDPHLAVVSRAPVKLGVIAAQPIRNTYRGEGIWTTPVPEDPHRVAILGAKDSTTLINEFGLMAAFAAMAYHRHVPVSERYAWGPTQLRGANKEACINNHKKHPLPALMKEVGPITQVTSENGRPVQKRGTWARWLEGKAPACVSDDGLFYETYVFQDEDKVISDVAIVFRGTENVQGQGSSDWKSNFSAAMGFEPLEYQVARVELKKTLAQLLDDTVKAGKPMPRIYAVGHSLGGGLAQMAAYTNAEILAAYAFNTTAVTDWSYLKLEGLVVVTDPIIYRIHERHEFLANLRAVTSRVNLPHFGRSDFEFNYKEDGGEVAKHSMSLLACNFAGFIAAQSAAGKTTVATGSPKSSEDSPRFAFGYDSVFAKKLFEQKLDGDANTSNSNREDLEALCSPAIRQKVCATPVTKDSQVCRS